MMGRTTPESSLALRWAVVKRCGGGACAIQPVATNPTQIGPQEARVSPTKQPKRSTASASRSGLYLSHDISVADSSKA